MAHAIQQVPVVAVAYRNGEGKPRIGIVGGDDMTSTEEAQRAATTAVRIDNVWKGAVILATAFVVGVLGYLMIRVVEHDRQLEKKADNTVVRALEDRLNDQNLRLLDELSRMRATLAKLPASFPPRDTRDHLNRIDRTLIEHGKSLARILEKLDGK